MAETTRQFSPGGVSRKGPERRRHKRFLPRECDLTLIKEASGIMKVLGAGGKDNLAVGVVDLSEGGARFVTRAKLAIGAKVAVTIMVRLFNDTVRARGTVCWCGQHPRHSGHFYIAVSFEQLDTTQTRKISSIREYLNSPEFKQKEEVRKRTRPVTDTSSLEYDV